MGQFSMQIPGQFCVEINTVSLRSLNLSACARSMGPDPRLPLAEKPATEVQHVLPGAFEGVEGSVGHTRVTTMYGRTLFSVH